MMNNKTVLIISDLHTPYNHQDLVPFLAAVKRKYKPTSVVCVGDETDKHAMSFHDSDPDLLSAGDELVESIKILKKLYKMFPVVKLVDSNHGSMHYRRGKAHGISRKYLRDYNDILEAPRGWTWESHVTLKLPNGQQVFITHGMKKNGKQLAESMGMNVIQGHFHSEYNIQYASNPNQILWSMMVGCLIDDTSMAFAYNKITPGRPIIGVGVIKDSKPELVPMVLDKRGRWIGTL